MKLIRKELEKNSEGALTLRAEEAEDLWHVYNLVAKKDHVTAATIRRVTSESATGSSSSERVRLTLTINIETIEFDPQTGVLSLNGRTVEENPHVKKGSYHRLDLELNRNFTIYKMYWDSIHLRLIERACDPRTYADVAAVVMNTGIAHVCLITPNMTIVRAKLEATIPRKRKYSQANHEKGVNKFHEMILQALLRHVDFSVVKCIVVASPGFVKDEFYKWMMEETVRRDLKVIQENKSKFMLTHSSSGFKHSLKEVLQDPVVANRLTDTKAAGEVKALQQFYEMMNLEPDRAFYGYNHVKQAVDRMAVETMLVTDELFRSVDLQTRKKYVDLVEECEESGATVHVFSNQHVSGEQLTQLSGIAAILRFPVPDIGEDDEDTSDDDDDDEDSGLGYDSDEESDGKEDANAGEGPSNADELAALEESLADDLGL